MLGIIATPTTLTTPTTPTIPTTPTPPTTAITKIQLNGKFKLYYYSVPTI